MTRRRTASREHGSQAPTRRLRTLARHSRRRADGNSRRQAFRESGDGSRNWMGPAALAQPGRGSRAVSTHGRASPWIGQFRRRSADGFGRWPSAYGKHGSIINGHARRSDNRRLSIPAVVETLPGAGRLPERHASRGGTRHPNALQVRRMFMAERGALRHHRFREEGSSCIRRHALAQMRFGLILSLDRRRFDIGRRITT